MVEDNEEMEICMFDDTEKIVQSGVIPYRKTDEGYEVLMITSRRTGAWQFPKGYMEPGMEPEESAAKEAFEEAGVEGQVYNTLIGEYEYTKHYRTYCVELYPLQVTHILDEWEEKGQRRRAWWTPARAIDVLTSPALQGILQTFMRSDPARWETSSFL